jgi:hypothetical protein
MEMSHAGVLVFHVFCGLSYSRRDLSISDPSLWIQEGSAVTDTNKSVPRFVSTYSTRGVGSISVAQ